MHDASPPPEPGPTDPGTDAEPTGYLTRERIDRILADFRSDLEALREPPPPPDREPAGFDLSTLVAQFTALRHDVNLQTKAARAATEQAAAAAAYTRTDPPAFSPDRIKPLLKVLVDVADSLRLAERGVLRTAEAALPLLDRLTEDPPATDFDSPGFFARLFGGGNSPSRTRHSLQEWVRQRKTATAEVRDRFAALLAGVTDGYAMSRRRVEQVLPTYGLEVIECANRTFDPERMEAVEVVGDTGLASGVVVEVVRPGYLLNGEVFRFAQVKVAR